MTEGHSMYRFVKFGVYLRLISPDAKSIGIVTYPFEVNKQTRGRDSASVGQEQCHIIVGELVTFLQLEFLRAVVRVHNDPDKTIALMYAHMIMANQTFAVMSTFALFPAIANFGTGYIKLFKNWLENPSLDTIIDDVVMINETNILMSQHMIKLWDKTDGKKVTEWFKDHSLTH